MQHPHRLKLIALAAVMLVASAACGQKPGVAEQGGLTAGLAGAEGVLDAEGNLVDASTGEIIATAEELETGTTTTGTGTTTTGTGTTTTDDGTTTGDDETTTTQPGEPSGGDATGVSDETIKIGIHAPITGAAPVPSQSFQKGKDLYWNWLESQKLSINGRNVEVVFRNDNYNPSQAVAACREMVEQEKVFLLVGVAGTDQIQACARYAEGAGVPYISAGVTELGLGSFRTYFTIWLSYAEQGSLLTDLMTSKLGAAGEKNGMVWFNTPTFQDGHKAWVDAMGKAGATVDYDRSIPKTSGASEAQTVATELNQQGIENVHVLLSPTFFIQLAQAAVNQGYRPQWVGYGLTMGLDTVANVACRNNGSIDDARFLSPFPAYVDSDKFDQNFRKAGGTDDIMFGLWGMSKVIGEMMKLPGKELTRERFIYHVERAKNIETGVLPPVSYTPEDHFGGTSMHQLRADCANNRYVTEKAFASDF
jgi:ABC-type branched-subunit amino acid transport system substrate-binding protein